MTVKQCEALINLNRLSNEMARLATSEDDDYARFATRIRESVRVLIEDSEMAKAITVRS